MLSGKSFMAWLLFDVVSMYALCMYIYVGEMIRRKEKKYVEVWGKRGERLMFWSFFFNLQSYDDIRIVLDCNYDKSRLTLWPFFDWEFPCLGFYSSRGKHNNSLMTKYNNSSDSLQMRCFWFLVEVSMLNVIYQIQVTD